MSMINSESSFNSKSQYKPKGKTSPRRKARDISSQYIDIDTQVEMQHKQDFEDFGYGFDPSIKSGLTNIEKRRLSLFYFIRSKEIPMVKMPVITPVFFHRVIHSSSKKGEGKRSSAASGDSNDDDPEPARNVQTRYLPRLHFTPTTTRFVQRLAMERSIALYEAQKIDAALANPASKEFQQFMRRAKTSDQAACWLALHKAKKQCLTTDRAARFARIEANNDKRVVYKSGVKAPETDRISRSLNSDNELPLSEKPAMLVIESKLAKCFQTKPEPEDAEDIDNEVIDEVIIDESESESESDADKKKKKDDKKKPKKRWAMQLIHQDEKELAFEPAFFAEHRAAVIEHERRTCVMMDLRGSLKKHDQEILELRFERGLNIYEIAAHFGQTHKAIRAAFERIAEILFKARERKEWADEHCNLQVLAADDDEMQMPVVPVVLEKDGQMSWDLEVQP